MATPLGSYTKGGGGYTNNFITLEGSADVVGINVDLALHTFDNLTVYRSPLSPSPPQLCWVVSVCWACCAAAAEPAASGKFVFPLRFNLVP
jgi:hypothetical protein